MSAMGRRPHAGEAIKYEGDRRLGRIESVAGDDVLVNWGGGEPSEWLDADLFMGHWISLSRMWELPSDDTEEAVDTSPWVRHAQQHFDACLKGERVSLRVSSGKLPLWQWLAAIIRMIPAEDHRHKIVEAMRNGQDFAHIRPDPVTNSNRMDIDAVLGDPPCVSYES